MYNNNQQQGQQQQHQQQENGYDSNFGGPSDNFGSSNAMMSGYPTGATAVNISTNSMTSNNTVNSNRHRHASAGQAQQMKFDRNLISDWLGESSAKDSVTSALENEIFNDSNQPPTTASSAQMEVESDQI